MTRENISKIREAVVVLSKLTDEEWEKIFALKGMEVPKPKVEVSEKSKKLILTYLKVLGISPNLKGYLYIETAVELVLEDREKYRSITKNLYPTVAKNI